MAKHQNNNHLLLNDLMARESQATFEYVVKEQLTSQGAYIFITCLTCGSALPEQPAELQMGPLTIEVHPDVEGKKDHHFCGPQCLLTWLCRPESESGLSWFPRKHFKRYYRTEYDGCLWCDRFSSSPKAVGPFLKVSGPCASLFHFSSQKLHLFCKVECLKYGLQEELANLQNMEEVGPWYDLFPRG